MNRPINDINESAIAVTKNSIRNYRNRIANLRKTLIVNKLSKTAQKKIECKIDQVIRKLKIKEYILNVLLVNNSLSQYKLSANSALDMSMMPAHKCNNVPPELDHYIDGMLRTFFNE